MGMKSAIALLLNAVLTLATTFPWPTTDLRASTAATSSSSEFTPRLASDVKRSQLPFAVEIVAKFDSGVTLGSLPACGGSLISPSYVLTAAVCCPCGSVDSPPQGSFTIILNPYNVSEVIDPSVASGCTQVQEDVTEYHCHPDFGGDYNQNNYCLIRLNLPTRLPPITLYDSSKIKLSPRPDQTGAKLYGAGFLTLDSYIHSLLADPPVTTSIFADIYQRDDLTVLDSDECAAFYSSNCTVPLHGDCTPALNSSFVICAAASTVYESKLFGDLGSAAFIKTGGKFLQIGIHSDISLFFGDIYNRIDIPSFKSWVAPFLLPTPPPSKFPSSKVPTRVPTVRPTKIPTEIPTRRPTRVPTARKPTKSPTQRPTTRVPTLTRFPTNFPTTRLPTGKPSKKPSNLPTAKPSKAPTQATVASPVPQACLNVPFP